MQSKSRLRCPWGRDNVDLSGRPVSKEEKVWIVNEFLRGSKTASNIAKRYKLKDGTVRQWVHRFSNGARLTSGSTAGAPVRVSEEYMDLLKMQVIDHKVEHGVDMGTEEFYEKMHEAAIRTSQETCNKLQAQVKPMSRTTRMRYMALHEIHTGGAEVGTHARQAACAKVRHAVSFAVGQSIMVPITDYRLLLNADGTAFRIQDRDDSIDVVYIGPRADHDGSLKAAAPTGSNDIGAYFVKYMLVISAGGFTGSPVFVIQDDRMDKEVIDIYQSSHLGLAPVAGSKGYVVFMKSRAGNEKYFEWLMSTMVIEFINHIKEMCEIPADDHVYFQLDGEPIQLEVFKSTSMRSFLKANNISIGKSCASSTEIEQPCDIGDIGKGCTPPLQAH